MTGPLAQISWRQGVRAATPTLQDAIKWRALKPSIRSALDESYPAQFRSPGCFPEPTDPPSHRIAFPCNPVKIFSRHARKAEACNLHCGACGASVGELLSQQL